MRARIAWLVLGLGLSLLALGAARLTTTRPGGPAPAGLVTAGYIVVVVAFTLALVRAGLPLHRVGFGAPLGSRHVLLAIVAIAVLRVTAVTLDPIWEALLGGPRNLGRFSDVGRVGGIACDLARRELDRRGVW